ncbi:hypothetical protein EDC04DRAFT_2812484 [Pisolithus marmoratus]|nr:hypothetical protein EDC04DRAFT_2812484 [Pisolithus marmoratus]
MRLAQVAFLGMTLVTLVVGGLVSRNAEGLSNLAERQTLTPSCPCASLNKFCDSSLPSLCCSGICKASVNLTAGTCFVSCELDKTCCETQRGVYSVIQQAVRARSTKTAAVVNVVL